MLSAGDSIASNWREQLISILSEDGVMVAPVVPLWRAYLSLFGQLLAVMLVWLAYVTLVIFAIQPAYAVGGDALAAIFSIVFLLLGSVVLYVAFVWPHFVRIGRRLRMVRRGIDPIDALRSGKEPPVLYLRAFTFDAVSSKPPFLLWALQTFVGGVADTTEMSLVSAVPRRVPVLAIGKPGETEIPTGAARFHVRDDRWQSVIEAVIPLCQTVIWTTGNSPGLRWEIEHLVGTVSPMRLLLWPEMRVVDRTRSGREEEWRRFREAIQTIFPRSLPLTLGAARFIAFDGDWTPLTVPGPKYPVRLLERVRLRSPAVFGLQSFFAERLQSAHQIAPAAD
jgi:hypothetical protein